MENKTCNTCKFAERQTDSLQLLCCNPEACNGNYGEWVENSPACESYEKKVSLQDLKSFSDAQRKHKKSL